MTEVLQIAIASIDASDRLRPLDQTYVDFLALSIEEQGVHEPIIVRPGKSRQWKLVAGAHRLAAAESLGWTEIPAVARYDLDNDDEARLVEIAENLVRQELSALDRAIFLREWQEAMKRVNPDHGHGGDRRSEEFRWKKSSGKLAKFADIAELVGLSERSIRRACGIAEQLDPKVIALLRGTAVADNQAKLQLLAGLDRRQQRKAAEALLQGTPTPRAEPSDEQVYNRLRRAFMAAPLGVRRRLLQELAEEAEA